MNRLSDKQSPSERKVFSISDLNRKAKELLEIHLPLIWVEGEISNFSKPSSGHWYFTLKDEKAQVRCAMFRGRNQLLRFSPEGGDKVLVRARVSLYEGRGEFQVIAEHMEAAGFGLLQKRFEELKSKLQAEGLFDKVHKQALPPYPVHVAVITSPTGAAIRDVLNILKRRFPLMEVTVLPSAVQGNTAAEQLLEALDQAQKHPHFELLILCRGGGSIEDLWAFNSEKLARAIFASRIPVVSAIGHEVDFTIADFVADLRAPTPSGAAELISPDGEELQDVFFGYSQLLESALQKRFLLLKEKLTQLRSHIRHPGERLQNWTQRLDHMELRLAKAMESVLQKKSSRLKLSASTLPAPREKLEQMRLSLIHNKEKLDSLMQNSIRHNRDILQKFMAILDVVSPLNTMERGYAIALDSQGNIVSDSKQVSLGDNLDIRLHRGGLKTRVEELKK